MGTRRPSAGLNWRSGCGRNLASVGNAKPHHREHRGRRETQRRATDLTLSPVFLFVPRGRDLIMTTMSAKTPPQAACVPLRTCPALPDAMHGHALAPAPPILD